MARGAVKVVSINGALTVTFMAASGATPTVFSDEACTSTTSLPATIADGANTTFYFASPGSYTLSVKTASGVQIAGDLNTTKVVTVAAGDVGVYAYDTRLVSRDASGDSGRHSPGTDLAATYAPVDPSLWTQGKNAFRPVPIATRAAPPFQTGNGLSDGVITGGTTVIRHQATRSAYGIRLMYSNHYPASAGGATETSGPNVITVKASIDYPSGTLFPVTFGGADSVEIAPGANVLSDPVGIDIAKGSLFWTRTYVSVAPGEKFPRGAFATHSAFGEGHNYGTVAGADVTASGAVPTTYNEYTLSPAAILGVPVDPGKAVVGIVGDSIVAGTGDDQTGWVSRLLSTNYSFQKVAYPSESMQTWATGNRANSYRRVGLLAQVGVTHVIAEHIVNDLGASSVPTLQGYAFTYWTYLSRVGKVYATTCTPQTTSTDAWVTTANQTVTSPATNEPRRVSWNAWLRDGAPMTAAGAPQAVGTQGAGVLRAGDTGHPLAGYIEIADLAESARDSGIWKAGYTDDGTHPNATGATAIAAGLTPATYFGSASAA